MDAKNKLVGFQGDFTFDKRVVTLQSELAISRRSGGVADAYLFNVTTDSALTVAVSA